MTDKDKNYSLNKTLLDEEKSNLAFSPDNARRPTAIKYQDYSYANYGG
jgi:hypothetical protein